jgi:hypothetical protein
MRTLRFNCFFIGFRLTDNYFHSLHQRLASLVLRPCFDYPRHRRRRGDPQEPSSSKQVEQSLLNDIYKIYD